MSIPRPARQPAQHGATCPCTSTATEGGVRRLWHLTKGPYPLLAELAGLDPSVYRRAFMHPARWVDHPYMLRGRGGSWTYVAEPYSLSGADWLSLQALDRAGYQVVISAEYARHVPGRTLAVVITHGTEREQDRHTVTECRWQPVAERSGDD